MKLQDIATVNTGQILNRVTDDEDTSGDLFTVLTPTSINEGFINKENLKETYIVKSVDHDKFTQEGDVMLKMSSPYDAAFISEEHTHYLIPSFLAVLRLNKDIDPYFMVALLNSEYFRNKIETIQTGASRPMIRVSDLRNVEIPDIPKEKMKELGEQYRLSCEKRALLEEMASVEKDLMDNILLQAIKEEKDASDKNDN